MNFTSEVHGETMEMTETTTQPGHSARSKIASYPVATGGPNQDDPGCSIAPLVAWKAKRAVSKNVYALILIYI